LSLGKKPASAEPEATPPVEQPTEVMSLFDIEEAQGVATNKTPRRQDPGARFVLKFSTGMSVTVGEHSGVVGVKTAAENDAVLRIFAEDDTDTVAPEHLEFGVEDGVFWVHDLKTVQGTVVEEPGAKPIQCIPYERYSLVRGSRVGLGQLSFTLH